MEGFFLFVIVLAFVPSALMHFYAIDNPAVRIFVKESGLLLVIVKLAEGA